MKNYKFSKRRGNLPTRKISVWDQQFVQNFSKKFVEQSYGKTGVKFFSDDIIYASDELDLLRKSFGC